MGDDTTMGDDTITLSRPPRCESCGQIADVELGDGSTWCESCTVAAHNLGYDRQQGRLISLMEVRYE